MILRDADDVDADQLEPFDIGDTTSPWLSEVGEIVGGLLEWRADSNHRSLDRRVVVLEEHGQIVAVAAHEQIVHERFGPQTGHRYVMVAAVRIDKQRSGLARRLLESILGEMQDEGIETVRWLVDPRNRRSISFNRRTFPEADETQPPEDTPTSSSPSRSTDRHAQTWPYGRRRSRVDAVSSRCQPRRSGTDCMKSADHNHFVGAGDGIRTSDPHLGKGDAKCPYST